jgi:NAD(P)H-hydrate epimerase
MGDVLTGVIAGFISQGYPPGIAAHLAVYLHGLAADILAISKGPSGFLASDVAAALPSAMAALTAAHDDSRQPAFRDPILEPL